MSDKSGKSSDPRSRGRGAKVRLKKARGMSTSSHRWLTRQLNDPYVAEAKRRGYRSRAAFKIMDLDDQFHLFRNAKRIVDLGAAPGGWTQVAIERAKDAKIVGIDLLPIDPAPGVTFLEMDFMTDEAEKALLDLLDGPVDLVMSDLAPSTTGHKATDQLRTMALCELAFDFAKKVLRPGGDFVAKVLRGGTDHELLAEMRRYFQQVKHVKPPSSRKESSEWFVVAKNFKGVSD